MVLMLKRGWGLRSDYYRHACADCCAPVSDFSDARHFVLHKRFPAGASLIFYRCRELVRVRETELPPIISALIEGW